MLWVPKACWIIISAYVNSALAPEYELISRIIKVRTEKKMTQKQLAEKIGTRQSNIARLECGFKREIKAITRSCKSSKIPTTKNASPIFLLCCSIRRCSSAAKSWKIPPTSWGVWTIFWADRSVRRERELKRWRRTCAFYSTGVASSRERELKRGVR